jgi:Spy/CpxP family protein refolding chaperone
MMVAPGLMVLWLALPASSAASNGPRPQEPPPGHRHEGHPGAPAGADARSPYAGGEGKNIKALSDEEIRSLREGTGHGMAIPAELNHYPGPRHVLDLAGDLGLTESQTSQVRAIFDRMHASAVSLGERIIERERMLDRAFAAGALDEAKLRELLGEIGRLRNNVRATHLQAHLETRAVLRPEQIARYDVLRGYAGR